jgi:hypothetical protein
VQARSEDQLVSKSWPYLAMTGLVVLLLTWATVVWLVGPWEGEMLPPADPVPGLLADDEPADGLAFPIALPGEDERAIREIYLSVGDGWRLVIRSNGTAHLGYGAADQWLVRPDTFDFPATLQALRAVARRQGFAGGRHYRVFFFPEGERSALRGYTQDSQLVLGLFDQAAAALHDRNDRFDRLWRDHPPYKIEER